MGDQVNGQDENKIWLVPDDLQAVRLDGFLRQCLPHLSRQEIHRAIADNFFLLNRRVVRKGDRLNGGDRLSFVGPADLLCDAPLPARQLEIPIIYEDESILAVDKPAGGATHGFPDEIAPPWRISCRPAARTTKLGTRGGSLDSCIGSTSRLRRSARRQTQAVFIAARTISPPGDQENLSCPGVGTIERGTIEGLGPSWRPAPHGAGSTRAERRPTGLRAITHDVSLPLPGMSLLRGRNGTGVTHQIRVHCRERLPIVGDTYMVRTIGPFRLGPIVCTPRSDLAHPASGQLLCVDAQLRLSFGRSTANQMAV